MRVALELQPCCGNRSGIGMYTYELAKRLKDGDGLEFCGNLFNFAGRNDNSAALQGIEMPIQECRLFPYGVYRRIWNYCKIPYQKLFDQPSDLSIFFDYIVPPHISGKVITTIHDMTYLRYPETMGARNLKRIRQGIDYSVERSDRIIAVSEFTKQEICTLLHVPEEKVTVIYNAPTELDMCCSQKADPIVQQPYILFVGTIEPRKNLERLIKAYTILRKKEDFSHKLVLAGGYGWKHESILKAAQESAYCDDIIFAGYVSAEKKRSLYQNADLFVFPSLYEGFGIPPLEAMAYGCPVVCSNAASLPEVAGDAAEYVSAENEENIARGIARVLSDRSYAGQLTANGSMQVRKYHWESSAKRLSEICQEVLGK